MKTQNKFFLLVFLFICHISVFSKGLMKASSVSLAGAQSGVTGAIKGFVKDAKTGEVIAKAKIILVSAKSDAMRYELQTDKKGYYYKGGLTPGYYKVTVEKEGFLPISKTIRVRLATTIQENFELMSQEPQKSTIPGSVKAARKAMKFFEQGQYEDAIKEFSEVISDNQSNALLYFYRGWAQEKNGNIEGALEDYQKAIELKPDFILPYSRSGIACAKQQSYEKASEFYQKSVELGDQDITTHYNYGVVLMNLGKSQEAKPVFENLLSLDENYSDAYYHLGIIYIGQGDVTKAKEFLQRFIELDPENSNAPIAKRILESLK